MRVKQSGAAVDLANLNFDAESEILTALRALEVDYQKNGKQWRCPSNPSDPQVRGSGNIIGSEALLCFLLPLSAMRSRPDFRQKIFDIVDEKALRERIESHLLSHKDRLDFTGHPYIQVTDAEKEQHPFIDSYCFVISILVIYGELFGIPKSKAVLEHFKFLFRSCLEGLKNSAIKGTTGRYTGFFATDKYLPDIPFKYPTWMAIDTLSDLQSLDDISTFAFATPESTDYATTLLATVSHDVLLEYTRLYIDNELTDTEKNWIKGRNVDLTKDIIREDEGDNSPHYNLWAAIILLYLKYTNSEKLASAFRILMPHVDDPRKARTATESPCKISFFSDRFPAGELAIENVMTDRCFLPQYVKGLSILLRNFPRLRADETFLKSLDKSLDLLLKNRKKDCVLWDKFAERDAPYAIYQTERAIEALCAFMNLRMTVAPETAEAAAPMRSAESLDRHLVDAVLRHAIVIQVGDIDARSLINREVANEVDKLRSEFLAALRELAAVIEHALAREDNQGGKPGALKGIQAEILGWAAELKMIRKT